MDYFSNIYVKTPEYFVFIICADFCCCFYRYYCFVSIIFTLVFYVDNFYSSVFVYCIVYVFVMWMESFHYCNFLCGFLSCTTQF